MLHSLLVVVLKIKIVILLLLPVGPMAAWADGFSLPPPTRIAILAGGSGNEFGSPDNFMVSTVNWSNYLLEHGWKVRIFFGDKKQQSRLKKAGLQTKKIVLSDFVWHSFVDELKSLKLYEDDQLFLAFFSHGSKLDHSLCAENDEKGPVVDLKPTLARFHAFGVKIGVFDDSCYGGNSVHILDSDDYCVAAGSGAATTNSDTFSASGAKILANGSAYSAMFEKNQVVDLDSDGRTSFEEFMLSARRVGDGFANFSTWSGDHPSNRIFCNNRDGRPDNLDMFMFDRSPFTSDRPIDPRREIAAQFAEHYMNTVYLLVKLGYDETHLATARKFLRRYHHSSSHVFPWAAEEPIITTIAYLTKNYGNEKRSQNICSEFYLD